MLNYIIHNFGKKVEHLKIKTIISEIFKITKVGLTIYQILQKKILVSLKTQQNIVKMKHIEKK